MPQSRQTLVVFAISQALLIAWPASVACEELRPGMLSYKHCTTDDDCPHAGFQFCRLQQPGSLDGKCEVAEDSACQPHQQNCFTMRRVHIPGFPGDASYHMLASGGRCVSRACQLPDVECRPNSCLPTEWCSVNATKTAPECFLRLEPGADCLTDIMCQSGICRFKKCTAVLPLQNFGECNALTESFICGTYRYCLYGSMCVARRKIGEGCTRDGNCAGGGLCVRNVCAPPPAYVHWQNFK